MNIKRIAGVSVTAISIAVLLSGSINYKDNITPSIKSSSSIEENIEVAEMKLDRNFQVKLEDKIEKATVELNGNKEQDIALLDVPEEIDIQGETQYVILDKRQDRAMKLTASRGRSYSPRELNHLKAPEVIAKEVLNGDYGNGEERKNRLESEGYNYAEIQSEISKLIPKIKANRVQSKPTVSRGAVIREKGVILKDINNVEIVEVAQEVTKEITQEKNNVIKAYPHKSFKSYMSWTLLSKSSPQGKLCAKATKDHNTAIMMINGRYLVALGFAYTTQIGEEIDVVMESGQVIPVIVGDWKAKEHTDKWNSASTNNGSIIEFIVSSNSDAAKATNSSGSYNSIFPGNVKEFRK